jgi:predicted nucleic acid-binding protein
MKLVDTSVVVDIDRGEAGRRVETLDDEGRHAISTVTLTGLRLGVNRQYDHGSERYREATEDLERLLSRFELVDVDRAVATTAADIIADLQERGLPLDNLHDIYIAATARTRQLAVLTANTDHFERIGDVNVVDWTAY